MSDNFDPKDSYAASQALKVQELSISGDDYQMYNLGSSTPQTITGNTAANPTVITTPTAHGLVSGQQVLFTGSNSTPALTGPYTVTVISSTTFSVPVNVSVAGTAGSFTSYVFQLRVLEPVKAVYDCYLKIDSSNSMYNFNSATISIVDSQGGTSGFNFSTGKQVSDQGMIQLAGFPATFNPNDCLVVQYKTQADLNTFPNQN